MRNILSLLFMLCVLTLSAQTPQGRTRVLIKTNKEDITVELYNETPLHRDNFIKLASTHYFDSLLFHRVIQDFMIQGGDPDSRGAKKGKLLGEGGPAYTLPAEIHWPQLYHKRGALAAAREGDDVNPDRRSSASQFYIVWGKTYTKSEIKQQTQALSDRTDGKVVLPKALQDAYCKVGGTPHLDGQYTVFGEVVSGLDVVDKIQRVSTDDNDRPLRDVLILSTTVLPTSSVQ